MFSAVKTVVKGNLNDDLKRLSQHLKCCCVKLAKKGILKKAYTFTSLDVLAKLKKKIPSLEIREDMAHELNANQEIFKMIDKVKPEALRVIFSTGVVLPPPHGVDTQKYFLEANEFLYYNPQEISLIVEMEKHFYGVFRGHKEIVKNIYTCLDLTFTLALKFLEEKLSHAKIPEADINK